MRLVTVGRIGRPAPGVAAPDDAREPVHDRLADDESVLRAGTRGPGSTTFGESCQARALHCALLGSRRVRRLVTAVSPRGTTVGYAAMTKSVTLSLDGEAHEVSALGDTVGDVLEAEGIEVGEHDSVAPGARRGGQRRQQISVRFGRPLELTVDGETADPLGDRHRRRRRARRSSAARFGGADLSASRGAGIDREGMALEVVTPKKITRQGRRRQEAGQADRRRARPSRDAARRARRQGRQATTRSSPASATELDDGDQGRRHRLKIVTKRVKREAVDFAPSSARTTRCTRARPTVSAPATTALAT